MARCMTDAPDAPMFRVFVETVWKDEDTGETRVRSHALGPFARKSTATTEMRREREAYARRTWDRSKLTVCRVEQTSTAWVAVDE